jgi:hypothetical protein
LAKTRIGRLLMELGLITQAQLDEALTAQQIYGGRLGTVLVEHGYVHEDDLARVLSEQSGVPLVPRDGLTEIDPRVIALVPKAVAERYHVVPFRLEIDPVRLMLATMDPANLRFSDELQFVLGRRVELRLCPEVVLGHALEKHYGLAREKRFIRLQRGETRAARRLSAKSAPQPPPAEGAPGVLARIAAATEVEAVLTIALDTLAGFGQRAAFLALHGEELVGWSARGLACSPDALAKARLKVGVSESVRRILSQRQCESLGLGAVDPQLALLLEGALLLERKDGEALFLPLVVGDRPLGVFVLQGPRPGKTVDSALLAELVRRVGWRAQAIQLTQYVIAPLAGL